MALFCAAIQRDSVSHSRFSFLSHVQIFSSLFVVWKCPYNFFSSHFCFLIIVILLIFVFFVLFLDAVISHSLLFFILSSSRHRCVDAIFNDGESSSSLFSFLSMSSLGCKALCIVMGFLVLWFICWSSFFIHFKSRVSYKEDKPMCLSFWWNFYYIVWFQVVFSFSWDILFQFFLSSPLVWWSPLSIFPSICKFPFLRAFSFFSWFCISFPFIICRFRFSLWTWCQIPSLYRHCLY